MTPQPKPTPRPRAPKGRIRRSGSPRRTSRKCGLYAHECGQKDEKGPCKRKKKAKKPKPYGLRKLEKIADQLYSLKIRSARRCVKMCQRELSVPELQASHGIGRAYKATRFDDENVMPSCAGDHKYFTERPFEWRDWLIATWGQERFDRLWAKAQLGVKVGYRPDYVDLIRRYWSMEEVQGALAECSEAKVKRLTREVQKVLGTQESA